MQIGHMVTAWHAFCAIPSAYRTGQIMVPAASTAIYGPYDMGASILTASPQLVSLPKTQQ